MSAQGISLAPVVLLVEPDNTVRGTVASVCRDLGIAKVQQGISVASAEQWLKAGRPKGLMLSMSEEAAALALLGKLRAGEFPCGPHIAVVAMAHSCTAELADRLKALNVRRLLLHPFKLRDVIQTIEQLAPEEGSKAPSALSTPALPETAADTGADAVADADEEAEAEVDADCEAAPASAAEAS